MALRGYRKVCLPSALEPGQGRIQPVLLLLSPGLARSAPKGRRERNSFIDSHYKELFRIPDGGKIKIRYSWNEERVRTPLIDNYHVEIGATSITSASLPSSWNMAAIPVSRFGTTCPSGAISSIQED